LLYDISHQLSDLNVKLQGPQNLISDTRMFGTIRNLKFS